MKPGGRLYGCNAGVLEDGKLHPDYSQEIIETQGTHILNFDPKNVKDFQYGELRQLNPEFDIDITVGNYFISTSIYERALKNVGFENVKQERFYIPLEGEEEVKK